MICVTLHFFFSKLGFFFIILEKWANMLGKERVKFNKILVTRLNHGEPDS